MRVLFLLWLALVLLLAWLVVLIIRARAVEYLLSVLVLAKDTRSDLTRTGRATCRWSLSCGLGFP